ncbi:MAG: homoserine kinase [Pseudomonadota bacterium]
MAVYTHIDQPELQLLIDQLGLGRVIDFTGIEQGVENTNYKISVETTHKEHLTAILTIFERRASPEDLPFFMEAMAFLAGKGIPTPTPQKTSEGQVILEVKGKPCALISFLPGGSHLTPSVDDSFAAGEALGKLHLAGTSFRSTRENTLSLSGWRELSAECTKAVGDHQHYMDLVTPEIDYLSAHWPKDLPKGLIHADYYPDNVFFDAAGAVSGIIDFYFSCTDFLAYDLAISLNAWSSNPDGPDTDLFNKERAAAFYRGYGAARPLSSAEVKALPILLRGASVRFLLTRLYDVLHQVEGALINVKDPDEYRRLLRHHQSTEYSFDAE